MPLRPARLGRVGVIRAPVAKTAVSIPFKGVVNIDIKDSTPDWAPYSQPMAPMAG
jgi:hypothetical protein